jgi:hypothetical protein
MCFVRISEQTPARISQCSINWLIFMTVTENVYCAVRAAYFTVVQVVLRLYRVHLSYTLKINASCHFTPPKLICVTTSLFLYTAYMLLLRWNFHCAFLCIGPYILLVISNSVAPKVISTFLDNVYFSLTLRRSFLIIVLCVHYPALPVHYPALTVHLLLLHVQPSLYA